jgi:hypothetical protein
MVVRPSTDRSKSAKKYCITELQPQQQQRKHRDSDHARHKNQSKGTRAHSYRSGA